MKKVHLAKKLMVMMLTMFVTLTSLPITVSADEAQYITVDENTIIQVTETEQSDGSVNLKFKPVLTNNEDIENQVVRKVLNIKLGDEELKKVENVEPNAIDEFEINLKYNGQYTFTLTTEIEAETETDSINREFENQFAYNITKVIEQVETEEPNESEVVEPIEVGDDLTNEGAIVEEKVESDKDEIVEDEKTEVVEHKPDETETVTAGDALNFEGEIELYVPETNEFVTLNSLDEGVSANGISQFALGGHVVTVRSLGIGRAGARKVIDGYEYWDYRYPDMPAIYVDGNLAFCMEPLVSPARTENASEVPLDSITETTVMSGYSRTTPLTPAMKFQITLIANYGYGYPGHNTDLWIWATQRAIWEALEWEVYAPDAPNTDAMISEINDLVAAHHLIPSWANTVRKASAGEVIDLSSPSMKTYGVVSSTGITVIEKTGTTFRVRVDNPRSASITLDKTMGIAAGTSLVYSDGSSQKVGVFKLSDPMTTSITFAPKEGHLALTKTDTNADVVPGTVFQISSNQSTVIGTATANASGVAEFRDLEEGSYYYRESFVPGNLVLDTTWKPFNITADEWTRLTVVNDFQRGDLTITKVENNWDQLQPDFNGVTLEGVTIALYARTDIYEGSNRVYLAGELVGERITNSVGQVTYHNLPIGDYYAEELATAEGYKIFEGQWNFTIALGNKEVEVTQNAETVTNQVIYGSVELVKTNESGDIRLPGATFELRRSSDDKVLYTITSDENGRIVADNLRYSTNNGYYFQEIEAPEGYWINPNRIYFDITSDQKIVYTIAPNNYIRAHIEFNKVDEDGLKLEGVGFKVWDVNALQYVSTSYVDGREVIEEDIWYTDALGDVFVRGTLPFGQYELHEVEPLEGYRPIAPIAFSIDKDQNYIDLGTIVGLSLDLGEIVNEWITGDIKIIKLDEQTGLPIEGVGFRISDAEGEVIEEVYTDINGVALVEDYRYGDYSVEEFFTPLPYIIDLDNNVKTVEIREDQEVYEVEFLNIATHLTIEKLDETTGLPIPNTVFNVYDKDMNFIEEVTTDENGIAVIEGYQLGVYYVEEMSVPFPHVVNPDDKIKQVEITKDSNDVRVTFENVTTSITIYKVDKETGLPIPNTEFNVYDEDMNFIETVVTDETGIAKVEGYDYGKYFVEEMKVPEPYVINPENKLQEIELTHENNHYDIKFENTIAKGQVNVIKVDGKNGKPVAGVEFELYDVTELDLEVITKADLEELTPVSIALTNVDGSVTFTDLDISKVYAAIEVSAPYGYDLSDEVQVIKFAFVDQDTPIVTREVTFVNERTEVTIKGIKVDKETGERINSKELVLELRDADGNVVPVAFIDDEGIFHWKVDALEKYTLHEINAPEGYDLSDEVIEIDTSIESPNNVYEIQFANVKTVQPETGMTYFPHEMVLVASGLLLAFMIIKSRRKEQE